MHGTWLNRLGILHDGSTYLSAVGVDDILTSYLLTTQADLDATTASKEGLSDRRDPSRGWGGGTAPVLEGYLLGDKVQALCIPVGGATGSKEYISGEVAHVNPNGSLDVILADGRMKQEVPVAEIKFVSRYVPLAPPEVEAPACRR